jgi:hypothetical protein
LRFVGEVIAGAELPDTDEHTGQRWHTIDVYRTSAGACVVHVAYTTERKGESDHDDAQSFPDLASAVAWLRAYNPVSYVTGWPPLPAYATRQVRLLLQLRERFAQLVSAVFCNLPEAAEVVA